jgi:PIN domain nuclease of toxin-antitoxin system
MVRLELAYLHEIGRILDPADVVLDALGPALQLRDSEAPFAAVTRRAVELSWTRDPFDRLLAANALVDEAWLVTADEAMLEHVPCAVWD